MAYPGLQGLKERLTYYMKGDRLMIGMRGSNWAGFLMLVIFLIVHEPIYLFVWSDSNILWAIPVVAYVIVAVVLMLRGGPDRDEA